MGDWTNIQGTLTCQGCWDLSYCYPDLEAKLAKEGVFAGVYGPIPNAHLQQVVFTLLNKPSTKFPFDYDYGSIQAGTGIEPSECYAPVPPAPTGLGDISDKTLHVTFCGKQAGNPKWYLNVSAPCEYTTTDKFVSYIQLWMDVLWAVTGLDGELNVCGTGDFWLKTPDTRFRVEHDETLYDEVAILVILKKWVEIQRENAKCKAGDMKYDFEPWYMNLCQNPYDVKEIDNEILNRMKAEQEAEN